ncbi:MAG TPA: hypothetical protein VMU84_03980 [Thermoanaerobaculia bacterium]|nr:hypothetical protein [Thermoanaerobaculia bacterium]
MRRTRSSKGSPKRSPTKKKEVKTRKKKRPRYLSLIEEQATEYLARAPVASVDGAAYAVTSFPIQRGQRWYEARIEAELNHEIWLTAADRWRGGLIIGFDRVTGSTVDFGEIFAALPAERLYRDTINTNISKARATRSRSDGALTIVASAAFHDVIAEFLEIALSAAFDTSVLVSLDFVVNAAAQPEPKFWYGTLPAVVPPSNEDRESVVSGYTTKMRDLLRKLLFDKGQVARRVGRKAEEDRDHRAYCLRERLVHSDEFLRLTRNERYARARNRVIQEVIAPAQGGCSPANYQRIMDSGKAIHKRLSPELPYCER